MNNLNARDISLDVLKAFYWLFIYILLAHGKLSLSTMGKHGIIWSIIIRKLLFIVMDLTEDL